jgi:peptidoglycan/xylan/chitin deacetylase (PgdA/CDA1 family)
MSGWRVTGLEDQIPPDPYPFVPIAERGPLKFPNGARVAMIFTINLETWEKVRPGQKTPMFQGPTTLPSPLPADVFDSTNHTWREYGQRVGAWRVFEVFDKAGVPASCTINALTILQRRQLVDAVKSRGWELVAHNWAQNDILAEYAHDTEAEKLLIDRTLEVFEQGVGRPARVWLSSALRSNFATPGLLAQRGVIALCDYLNDDQPYLIATPHGPMVATPYSNDINDFTMFARGNATPEMGLASLKDYFDELYREGANSGRIMNLGLHPHVIGQPHRIQPLRQFIDYVKGHEGIWFCSREELARWYLDNHKGHIPAQETA